MGQLDGKVALVTGAARGQGLAEATRFVAEGAAVVLTDVLVDEGAAAAAALGERARFIAHDVRSGEAWAEVVAFAVQEFGGVDILVNNAGVYGQVPLPELDETTFRRFLDINLVGPFLGIQSVTPSMIERGGGAIVNISSLAGLYAVPFAAAYTTSKFGLRGLTRAAAKELGPHGIRVNTICPGIIRTPMIAGTVEEREHEVAAGLPVRRIGEAEDVANLVLFLVSEQSSFITGTEHVIDGGSRA